MKSLYTAKGLKSLNFNGKTINIDKDIKRSWELFSTEILSLSERYQKVIGQIVQSIYCST